MQLSIRLDQAALDSYTAELDRMAERAVDAEPAMKRIADDFLAVERRSFASGGHTRTGGWEPDTAAWSATKAHRGKSGRTLVYTGTLERSLTEPYAKYSLHVTGPGEVIVGTLDPVAHLTQDGTGERFVKTWRGKPMRHPRFAGRMPRRVVAEVLPTDIERWSLYVREWLLGTSDLIAANL